MTRAPTPTEKSKKQHDNIKNASKNFDYTTIADQLRFKNGFLERYYTLHYNGRIENRTTSKVTIFWKFIQKKNQPKTTQLSCDRL